MTAATHAIRHLIKIADLAPDALSFVLQNSLERRRELASDAPLPAGAPRKPVAFLFFENSTRTRVSFERAAQLVNRPSILIEARGSSFMKGETLEDTVLNLRALHYANFVVRTHETQGLEIFRNWPGISVINAGDGTGEHPTQALLDACTLMEVCGGGRADGLRGFRLGIYGDLRHSRVAHSWNELAPRLGIELTLMSPEAWKPSAWLGKTRWTPRPEFKDLDAVMALRVQRERHEGEAALTAETFVQEFRLSPEALSARQYLMHPGPVNWGVELDAAWKGDSRNLILHQVESGLAVRSVLLDHLENG